MVRIPLFPKLSALRGFLSAIEGVPRERYMHMRNSIQSLTGRPQEPVDWSDPDSWIGARLDATDAETARRIWEGSGKKTNPRHTKGAWWTGTHYDLVEEDSEGVLRLTDGGRALLEEGDGDHVQRIDREEGVLYALYLVSANPRSKLGGLTDAWRDYLRKNSNYRKESSVRDTLRRRLANLRERGYVTCDGVKYDVAPAGQAYLDRAEFEVPKQEKEELRELRAAVQEFSDRQRQMLREKLQQTDPTAFEHLVRDLLEAMGYDDVTVTSPSNDKGVDVTARAEYGITTVTEVVQVKRTQANIHRPVLDALRGALHRFGAFRGSIITIAGFSQGTKDAALEKGAAPITLVDGERLLDLLIEHQIGVDVHQLSYFTLALDEFQDASEEELLSSED